MTSRHSAAIQALLSAALFGATTPFAKLLLNTLPPAALAGLFYLGAGAGLLSWYGWRSRADRKRETSIVRNDLPWLAGAIGCGGVAAPLLLMYGLQAVPAATTLR